MRNTHAIIVAGGKGLRVGNALPKQFLEIDGKPLLYYSMHAFINAIPDIKLTLVLPSTHLNFANAVLRCFEDRIDVDIVSGGEQRFHSVQNGFASLSKQSDEDIVFVHDAARPFLSTELILRCLQAAEEKGNAIPAVALKDSIRQLNNEHNKAVDRSLFRAVQTPQTFTYSVLERIVNLPYQDFFTDEASCLDCLNIDVNLIEGEEQNFKVTNAHDFRIAEFLLG